MPDTSPELYAGRFAFRFLAGMVGDIVDVVPAAGEYMVDEMSMGGRYFWKHPLDAIMVLQLGTGALAKGGRFATRMAATPGALEGRLLAAGLTFDATTGRYITKAGQVATQAELRALIRGGAPSPEARVFQVGEDVKPVALPEARPGSSLGEQTRMLDLDVRLALEPKPTAKRQRFQRWAAASVAGAERLHSWTNPLNLIADSARGIAWTAEATTGQLHKVFPEVPALAKHPAWMGMKMAFRDKSSMLNTWAYNKDTGELYNLYDKLKQRGGRKTAYSEDALTLAHEIPDENVAQVERLLRGMAKEDGWEFLWRCPRT